ncbi:MAG: zinc ribbon domain-containing protein [Desulfovibrio sp.]|nr:zinc ribbon domain-containing protein [Desulfovibrio sp.]
MPMFDFVCTVCGHKFEELVNNDAVMTCPQCGATAQRQMSVPSPLKKGAFPYKPGPVRPLGSGMPPSCASNGCTSCGSSH